MVSVQKYLIRKRTSQFVKKVSKMLGHVVFAESCLSEESELCRWAKGNKTQLRQNSFPQDR